MNQLYQELLARVWPYRPAYWIFGISASLALSLFVYPEKALELFQIQTTKERVDLLKWAISGYILFAGTLGAHALTVSYYSTLKRDSKFKTITLKIGAYEKFNLYDGQFIKITLDKISKEQLLPEIYVVGGREETKETMSATLTFYPSMMYCGRRVKKYDVTDSVMTETFTLPVIKNIDMEESVYSYHVKDSGGMIVFFYCSVEHINAEIGEAEINVCSVIAPKFSR